MWAALALPRLRPITGCAPAAKKREFIVSSNGEKCSKCDKRKISSGGGGGGSRVVTVVKVEYNINCWGSMCRFSHLLRFLQ